MQLKEFLLKVCQDKDVLHDLKLILGKKAPNVGLLVSQRVVNLPPQLLPPLYDALFDEVSWATEDEVGLLNTTSVPLDEFVVCFLQYSNEFACIWQWLTHSFIVHLKPTEQLRDSFRFKCFLLITKFYEVFLLS